MLFRPKYLARLRHVAAVLTRHGFEDVLDELHLRRLVGRRRRRRREILERDQQRARKLREALEELGTTYIKLGQLLSTRPDILPPVYLHELARLQDSVEPVPFAEIRKVVEAELGRPIVEIFASFEKKAFASASLAQVHRAELAPRNKKGRPREVAVKVLKPGVEREVGLDLAILKELARFLSRTAIGRRYDFVGLADQLEHTLMAELDLTREARNAETLRESLSEFSHLRIPRVVKELVRERVLVLEYVSGRRIADELGTTRRPVLADELWRAYLKQILVVGAFHCDPHPGNLLLDDKGRIVLLDHGMMAFLSREAQLRLMSLLVALVEREGDRAAEACIDIGVPGDEFRERPFRAAVGSMVARYSGVPIGELPLGDLLTDLVVLSFRHDIRIPPEMMLLGKTLLNLEPICRGLDPDMDPVETMREMATSLLAEQIARDVSTQTLLGGTLELRSFLSEVPSSLRRILTRTSSNELRLGVRLDGAEEMQAAVQKVANRIALALITAALIVGSALLLNVDAGVKVWGYPVFALVGFLLAAGLGLYLVGKILLGDRY